MTFLVEIHELLYWLNETDTSAAVKHVDILLHLNCLLQWRITR